MEFLCDLANSSKRPRSMLNNASAAITCLYDSQGLPNPMFDPDIRKLVIALVKTGTDIPRSKTPVMPIQPFKDLFRSWPDNAELSIKQLRQKSLALLAITTMLRPSDVAPHAKRYVEQDDSIVNMVFSTDLVTFNDDGSATLRLHGIKNDYSREGFEVHVDSTNDKKLDPVYALWSYIDRTKMMRPPDTRPVFLTLNRPYHAINSGTVANILNDAILLAGLDRDKYSAKCFRPSGATEGIRADCNPDVLRQLGRWRNREVFEAHYVHSEAQKGMTSKILSHET